MSPCPCSTALHVPMSLPHNPASLIPTRHLLPKTPPVPDLPPQRGSQTPRTTSGGHLGATIPVLVPLPASSGDAGGHRGATTPVLVPSQPCPRRGPGPALLPGLLPAPSRPLSGLGRVRHVENVDGSDGDAPTQPPTRSCPGTPRLPALHPETSPWCREGNPGNLGCPTPAPLPRELPERWLQPGGGSPLLGAVPGSPNSSRGSGLGARPAWGGRGRAGRAAPSGPAPPSPAQSGPPIPAGDRGAGQPGGTEGAPGGIGTGAPGRSRHFQPSNPRARRTLSLLPPRCSPVPSRSPPVPSVSVAPVQNFAQSPAATGGAAPAARCPPCSRCPFAPRCPPAPR